MVCNRRRNSSSLSCLRSDSRVIALRYFISSFCSSPWLAIIHGIVQYCFASFPSAGGLLSFATSSLLILAFCWFFLLQCKTLDQPPLTFVFFSLKIPQRKDGTLPLKTEGAFLCNSMAAMLRNSTVGVAVVRTRPRAIPLAMITMRKSIRGFPSISIYGMLMGLRLAALQAAGAPLKVASLKFNIKWQEDVIYDNR